MDSTHDGLYKPDDFYETFAAFGEDSRIFRNARIVSAGNISIGRGCKIHDFAFVAGGQSLVLGDRVNFSSFSSIVGGGTAHLHSYSTFAAGCRLITGSDNYMGDGMASPCIPSEFRSVTRGELVIGKHALLFTNVIVYPNVEVGEGCVVSAGSIVSRSLKPWGVYKMKHGRITRICDRPRETILRMEQECIATYGY